MVGDVFRELAPGDWWWLAIRTWSPAPQVSRIPVFKFVNNFVYVYEIVFIIS